MAFKTSKTCEKLKKKADKAIEQINEYIKQYNIEIYAYKTMHPEDVLICPSWESEARDMARKLLKDVDSQYGCCMCGS